MVYVSIKLNLFCEFSLGESILMKLESCIFFGLSKWDILSEIFKITIMYGDDVLEFLPSISIKDKSMMAPDRVTDAEKIFD